MVATTVPLLPCTDPDATVEFYEALGFAVTHRQERPYLYLALRLGDIEVHFKGASAGLDPTEENSGGFLVLVEDAASLHATFADRLRVRYGRVPAVGLPRLTRHRPGQTRFCLYDPSGNCGIVIDRDEPDVEYGGSRELSGLARSLDNVRILRDFKNDDVLAARALDAALNRHRDTATRIDLARAFADRAELAVALGDRDVADRMRAELEALALDKTDRDAIAAELAALESIEEWMGR